MAVLKPAKRSSVFFEIPMSIWAIGFVSLLINASSVIIFNVFPFYATKELGVSYKGLGVIEGVLEAISWFTRIFSGVLSDFLHKRKPILMAALGLIAASRFIFPIAQNIFWIVGARALDRVGNGLQASPREALVGDAAPKHLKGASYGLRQTLSLIGSFAGSLFLMYMFYQMGINYKLAFVLSLVFSVIAFVILLIFVKDRGEIKTKKPVSVKPFHLVEISNLPKSYWVVVFVASFFMLSNYSSSFMMLRGEESAGMLQSDTPVVMVIQNLAAFMVAFPFGWLSDKLGRVTFLFLGFSLVILSNFLLSSDGSLTFYLLGVAIWGVQLGINQSLIVASIADSAPAELRGSAFGIYYIIAAISVFTSNYVGGLLSHHYGAEWIFYGSSAVACVALLMLPLLGKALKNTVRE